MQFSSIFAIAASAALAAASEQVTISNFVYQSNNGYPQMRFDVSLDNVVCSVDHYTVPGEGYACSDPAWTFDVLEEHGQQLTLHHEVDGTTLSGDFEIQMNGPIPTILDQVGNSTSILNP
ncbi:hypothetical protein F4780DRAFT_746441 [Xylariomycetidae sp. FL0641]|nr:hypothetical protein F4780DRAFT_746441 [Xylariomycetidae sp. FL0641]